MPTMKEADFFSERAEYDLRNVSVPYKRKGGLVTVSADALKRMRAAPSIDTVEVTGAALLSSMTDAEIKQASGAGLSFLARPVSEKFMKAKRRFLGRSEEAK